MFSFKKNKFREKFKKIFQSLNKESTFALFSSDEGKSKIKTIRHRTLFLLSFCLLILLFSSTYYLITKENRNDYLTQLKENNKKKLTKLETLKKKAKEINLYQQKYEEEINSIFKPFANLEQQSIWNQDFTSNQTDFENTLRFSEIGNVELDPEILKLNEKRIDVLVTIKHLEEIGKYIGLRNELFKHIPIGWPIARNRGYKTSGYGPRFSPFTKKKEFHTGVDIATAAGTPILATASGKVIFSGDKNSFGLVIMIRHQYGYLTVYGHNRKNLVKPGDQVKKFQKIAIVGMTGRATGPHIHYEIRIGRQHVDPWEYLISKF